MEAIGVVARLRIHLHLIVVSMGSAQVYDPDEVAARGR